MSATQSLSITDHVLANRTGRGVIVAVIDSGVHAAHPHIVADASGFSVSEHGARGADIVDRLGHGTAVTAAIMEKAPEAAYRIVKVFDDRLSGTSQHLIHAVRASVADGARLVNLSLAGTCTDARPAWATVVTEAIRAGAIIVAPCDRRQEDLLPGSLSGVVRVVLDPHCPRGEIRVGLDLWPTIAASGYPRPIPNVPVHRNVAGVSFAVANVTGMLALLLEGQPHVTSAEGVFDLLRAEASHARR